MNIFGYDLGDLSGVGSFLTKNKDWIKPLVSTGLNLYANNQAGDSTNQYIGAIQKAQQDDYNNQKTNYDAYTQWLQTTTNANNANSAAKAKASNANASRNERSRLAGVKSAQKILRQTYDKMSPYIDPYADMGLRVRPQIESTYTGALKALGDLTQQQTSPEAMKQWNQSVPSWQTNAPLPDWMKR